MEENYEIQLGESYQFLGLVESMGKNVEYFKDINGKPERKILARRGKDDRPQDYNSKKKLEN